MVVSITTDNYLVVGQINTSPLTTVPANITNYIPPLPPASLRSSYDNSPCYHLGTIRYRKTLPAFPTVSAVFFACELRLLCSLVEEGNPKINKPIKVCFIRWLSERSGQ